MVAADPALQAEVEAIRACARSLEVELAAEPMPALSESQRSEIEDAAGRGAEETSADLEGTRPLRGAVGAWWRLLLQPQWGLGLAGAAAVVLAFSIWPRTEREHLGGDGGVERALPPASNGRVTNTAVVDPEKAMSLMRYGPMPEPPPQPAAMASTASARRMADPVAAPLPPAPAPQSVPPPSPTPTSSALPSAPVKAATSPSQARSESPRSRSASSAPGSASLPAPGPVPGGGSVGGGSRNCRSGHRTSVGRRCKSVRDGARPDEALRTRAPGQGAGRSPLCCGSGGRARRPKGAALSARYAMPRPMPGVGGESYQPLVDTRSRLVTEARLSTFGIDVDTASYANVRRFLTSGQLPLARRRRGWKR